MKCKLILLLLIFCCTFLHAQQDQPVKIKIINEKTLLPVEFAAVSFANLNTGILADANGFLQLDLDYSTNIDSLIIYSIGYEKKAVSILSLNKADTNRITLTPFIFNLPVADVKGISAKEIVRKAIQKIPINFLRGTFYQDGNYVQYHCENGKYVRLIIADVSIKNQIELNGKLISNKEQVFVKSLSRTRNNEQNKEEHGDHFFDLLAANPVCNSKGSVLNPNALNDYKFVYDTTFDFENTWKILFTTIDKYASKKETGSLMIDKKSFAILRIEEEEIPDTKLHDQLFYPSSTPYTWKFLRAKLVVEFEEQNDKWITKNIYKMYSHNLIDNKVHSKAYTVDEFFELHLSQHNVNTAEVHLYSDFSNLYSAKCYFNDAVVEDALQHGFYFIPSEVVTNDVGDWLK